MFQMKFSTHFRYPYGVIHKLRNAKGGGRGLRQRYAALHRDREVRYKGEGVLKILEICVT